MFYRRRELRRLWEVDVYDGDPEDPDVEIRTETLIAWNAVDAIRHSNGSVVSQPRAVCFVSWPEGSNPNIYRVDNTGDGPVGDAIVPSVRRHAVSGAEGEDEEW